MKNVPVLHIFPYTSDRIPFFLVNHLALRFVLFARNKVVDNKVSIFYDHSDTLKVKEDSSRVPLTGLSSKTNQISNSKRVVLHNCSLPTQRTEKHPREVKCKRFGDIQPPFRCSVYTLSKKLTDSSKVYQCTLILNSFN